MGIAESSGEMCGDRHAGSRAGLDQADRELTGEVEAQRATAGAHHEEGAARAPFLQALRRARPDIATSAAGHRHWPPWWRRGHTRRSPAARARTATRRDPAARPGWPLPRPPRWPGWHRRAESTRRRPRRPRPKRAKRVANLVLRERREDLPVETRALGHADAAMSRHQRLGELDEQIVQVVAKLGPGLERIAETARGEQGGACTLALDDRVGRQRRAVHDRAYGCRALPWPVRAPARPPSALPEPAARVWSAPWPNRRRRSAHPPGSRL